MDEIFHKIVDDNWYMLNVRESDGTIDRPFIEKSGRLLAKRKGRKNKYETGTPTKILFAKITEFSVFLCSKYEKAIAIMLAIGNAIIKPDNSGFFPESQLANAIIVAASKIFKKKIIFYFIVFKTNFRVQI